MDVVQGGAGRRLHPHDGLHAVLPLHGGLGGPLLQQERRADQGQGHGHRQDGGHRHEAVAPEIGRGLLRDVAGGDGHQVPAAKLSGKPPSAGPAGTCSGTRCRWANRPRPPRWRCRCRRRRGPGRAPACRRSSSMTRRRIWSTMPASWVAMITVVPVRLIRSRSFMIPRLVVRVEVAGGLVGQQDERPVDEGPGHGHPLLLATGQLVGQVVPLLGQPDQVEHLGHLGGDDVLGAADDLEGEGHVLEDGLVGQEAEVLEHAADVAAQVGIRHLGRWPISLPASQIRPESGSSSRSRSRMKVVLPDPTGPTRKTNSPLSISTVQSRSATVEPLYVLVTFSNRDHAVRPRTVGATNMESGVPIPCNATRAHRPELGQPP